MIKQLFLIILFLTSCSSPSECPELIFEPNDKTTSVNGSFYTGRCMTFVDGRKRSIQQYLNGKDYGKWIFYFSDGSIQTKGRFDKSGLRIGRWKYFHENGVLKQLSKYSRKGERIGKWIEYNEEGEIINETDYIN
jgi:antitoxin component YwqK of YwqJK toxin-antitoxin module